VISEVTRLVLPVLSNDLNTAHLKKFKHFESNVLKLHSVETKVFGGIPVKCTLKIYWQMILEESK